MGCNQGRCSQVCTQSVNHHIIIPAASCATPCEGYGYGGLTGGYGYGGCGGYAGDLGGYGGYGYGGC